jgi:hypothetical protein
MLFDSTCSASYPCPWSKLSTHVTQPVRSRTTILPTRPRHAVQAQQMMLRAGTDAGLMDSPDIGHIDVRRALPLLRREDTLQGPARDVSSSGVAQWQAGGGGQAARLPRLHHIRKTCREVPPRVRTLDVIVLLTCYCQSGVPC